VNADTASRKYASTRVVHPSRGVGVRTFKLGLAGPASPPDLPTTRADVRTLLRFAVAGESPNTEEDTAEKLIVCCFGRRHKVPTLSPVLDGTVRGGWSSSLVAISLILYALK
jgi:hypothetical protein